MPTKLTLLGSAAPPRATRGPHAERTAAMRARVIDAAIGCLCKLGYAATTTHEVTIRAGVSRGAVLHHFPTKVDLMLAVAQQAADHQNTEVRRLLAETPRGMPIYLALTEATWQVVIQPPAIALVEVMMATRSDPALAQRLPAVVEAFEERQRDDVWRLARRLGINDREAVDAMVRLHRAAMRGLALELNLTGDRNACEASIELLKHYKRLLTGELVTAPGAGHRPPPQRGG